MFERKGQFLFDAAGKTEDVMMEIAMEVGADDVKAEGDYFALLCEPSAFAGVQTALAEKGLTAVEADVVQLAGNLVKVEDEDNAKRVAKLLDALDDHDDVQNVYSNADLPESAYS
jgi:transcriptional/translational regulatory protein YebC/TACO1